MTSIWRATYLGFGLFLVSLAPGCGGAAENAGGDGAGDGDGDDVLSTGGSSTGGDSTGGSSIGGSTGRGGSGSGGNSTGGSGSGGEPEGGSGGADQGSGGQGTGGGASCLVEQAGPFLARAARSAGFAGTDAEYSEMYNQLCTEASDCTEPCLERGGTEAFCATHVCIDSTDDYCLPPTKWRSLEGALTLGTTTSDAAETSLSLSNGDEHDLLLLSDFGFEIPEGAQIVGIVAALRKARGATDSVSDYAVHLLKAGEVAGYDLGTDDQWPTELTDVEYGSMSELWGATWLPAEVNDSEFGVAIGALPGQNSGRAYVDAASVTIYYQPACE